MGDYNPRFLVPGNLQVVGPSLSGKTTWLYRLLKDTDVYFSRENGDPVLFKKVVYCYGGGQWQPVFDKFKALGVEFHQGLPEDVALLFPPSSRPGLVVLDDLMKESAKSDGVSELLTRLSHHLDLFVIALSQNLFGGGKEQASQNRN